MENSQKLKASRNNEQIKGSNLLARLIIQSIDL